MAADRKNLFRESIIMPCSLENKLKKQMMKVILNTKIKELLKLKTGFL